MVAMGVDNINDVMGLINLQSKEEFFAELTEHRLAAAVPFGGRYRLIDFTLSSMVNSGISNVGIVINKNAVHLLITYVQDEIGT